MALKPEFIGLLRDIRDRIFPSVSTAHDDVVIKHAEVVELTGTLQEISVEQPITVIPTQPNGEPGLPTVIYNNETNEFEFGIPAGTNGEDLSIKWVVDLTADLYVLIPETGDVAYSNEDGKLYIKKNTGVNLNAADWTTGTIMTPTTTFRDMTDTPIEYVGFADYIVTVAADETKLVFRTVQDLTQPIADLKVNKTGDTMIGALIVPAGASGTQVPQAQEVVKKIGGTMSGQLKGITPINAEDLTRKDYVDERLKGEWIEKWTGSETSILNYWGDGLYLIRDSQGYEYFIAVRGNNNMIGCSRTSATHGTYGITGIDRALYIANSFRVVKEGIVPGVYQTVVALYKIT